MILGGGVENPAPRTGVVPDAPQHLFAPRPVIPDAPQHHSSGEERVSGTGANGSNAVLIRDRRHAIGGLGGKIPCLRRNMKTIASQARDDGEWVTQHEDYCYPRTG